MKNLKFSKRKIIFWSFTVAILFILVMVWCYKVQFSKVDNVAAPRELKPLNYSMAKEHIKISKGCDVLNKKTKNNYTIHFEFPVVWFNGLFTVTERFSIPGNSYYDRTIYSTENFKSCFTVSDVCYPSNIKKIKTEFTFVEKDGDIFFWSLEHPIHVNSDQNTLKVKLMSDDPKSVGKKAHIIIEN